MRKLKYKGHHVPLTLAELNQKLTFEVKRLVREKEEGIVKHVSTKASLNGISTLVFRNASQKKVTLSYRHDESGNLRFAREKQFTDIASVHGGASNTGTIGRTSGDIKS